MYKIIDLNSDQRIYTENWEDVEDFIRILHMAARVEKIDNIKAKSGEIIGTYYPITWENGNETMTMFK